MGGKTHGRSENRTDPMAAGELNVHMLEIEGELVRILKSGHYRCESEQLGRVSLMKLLAPQNTKAAGDQ